MKNTQKELDFLAHLAAKADKLKWRAAANAAGVYETQLKDVYTILVYPQIARVPPLAVFQDDAGNELVRWEGNPNSQALLDAARSQDERINHALQEIMGALERL